MAFHKRKGKQNISYGPDGECSPWVTCALGWPVFQIRASCTIFPHPPVHLKCSNAQRMSYMASTVHMCYMFQTFAWETHDVSLMQHVAYRRCTLLTSWVPNIHRQHRSIFVSRFLSPTLFSGARGNCLHFTGELGSPWATEQILLCWFIHRVSSMQSNYCLVL